MATIESAFAGTTANGDPPTEAELPTKEIAIGGRMIPIRALNDTQITQMNHEVMVLESDRHDMDRKRKAMDRIYRALQSTIIEDDDREFAADLMADGVLD